ncbi:MAG: hypothetical protein H0S84_09315 [Bacteroidales bacterium]|jgi:hypothetical protein|nr:hypothetical protein [Bacteroidales bacterium]
MNKNFTPNACSNPIDCQKESLEEHLIKIMKDASVNRPSANKVRFLAAYAAALNCCKSRMAGDLELVMN